MLIDRLMDMRQKSKGFKTSLKKCMLLLNRQKTKDMKRLSFFRN